MSFLNDVVWLTFLVNAMAGLSFYVVYAAGQFNVSQPGFMLIGAYAAAVATTQSNFPAWYGVPAGIAIVMAVAFLLSRLTARLHGVYLAIATLSFVVIAQQVVIINPGLGGASGLFLIPLHVDLPRAALLLVGVAALVRLIMRSRLGYEMRTAREDEVSAEAIGIHIPSLRLKTALLSACIAALAGAALALSTGFVNPQVFGFSSLISILAIAIVGGTDRWWGPVLGAGLLTILPELTRTANEWREVMYGALILAIIIFFPDGMVGVALRLRDWFAKRLSVASSRQNRDPVSTTRGSEPAHLGEVITPPLDSSEAVEVLNGTDLSKQFGGLRAVDRVTIRLNASRIYGLIGPNGAGKSTLVDLLSGRATPSSGSVLFKGRDMSAASPTFRARAGLGRTFQLMRLPQNMTVSEVVLAGSLVASDVSSAGYILGLPSVRAVHRRARADVKEILRTVGLSDVAQVRVRYASFGEQRLLEIGRALALNPSLLLLDEPTAGLNRELLPRIAQVLRSLAENGVAVVIIEHNVAFIRDLVHDLYVLDTGTVIAHGEPNKVLSLDAVVASYVGKPTRTEPAEKGENV